MTDVLQGHCPSFVSSPVQLQLESLPKFPGISFSYFCVSGRGLAIPRVSVLREQLSVIYIYYVALKDLLWYGFQLYLDDRLMELL